LNFARYNHDEYLNNVRFILENFVEEYLSYRLLLVYNRNVEDKEYKYTRPTPDALMRDNGRTYAIELENTLKQDFRYKEKIFKGYEKNDRVDTVFYICTSRSILDNVNRLIKEFSPRKTSIYVIEYEKLMNAKEKFIAMVYKRKRNNNIEILKKFTFHK